MVNDGSLDATLERLVEAFDLSPVRRALRGSIQTAPIREVYGSRRHRGLWVIDKQNGGTADALNAGVNAARSPYVCAIDADGCSRRTRSCASRRRCSTILTSSRRPGGSSASPTDAASSTAV